LAKPELFANEYDEFTNEAWCRPSKDQISIDAQAAASIVTAHVRNGVLNVGGGAASGYY
jgi:hypothetical protein